MRQYIEWFGFPSILPWSTDIFRSILDLLCRLCINRQYVDTVAIQKVTWFLDLLFLRLRIFLFWLRRSRKLSISSILGYRIMLAAVFCFKLPEISTSPILLDLMRSFKVEVPAWSVCPPTCDLELILWYPEFFVFWAIVQFVLTLSTEESIGFGFHWPLQGRWVTGFIYSSLFLFFWCLYSLCSRICGQDRVGSSSPSSFFYY